MAGPCDHGGIHLNLGDDDQAGDALRDMHALIRAILQGDEDGQDVILANAHLRNLAQLLASTVTGCLIAVACGGEADIDAPPTALTDDQLHAVEAFLATAWEGGPDDELDGMWS